MQPVLPVLFPNWAFGPYLPANPELPVVPYNYSPVSLLKAVGIGGTVFIADGVGYLRWLS